MKTFATRAIMMVLIISAFQSCRKHDKEDLLEMNSKASISEHFDFKTTKSQRVSIKVLGNDNKPLKKVPISISVPIEKDSFARVFKGYTNNDGILSTELELASTIENVLVSTTYIGLPQQHYLQRNRLGSYTIQNSGIDVPGVVYPRMAFKNGGYTSKYAYLGTWDNNGVPKYKKTVRDVIPQSMLDDINGSLPEYKPVPTYNPQYLNNAETNTKVIKKADVWVTFVHEGAGYKNVLGYYTYNLNNPPTSTSDISKLNIVFPNVSYSGSGGGLKSGDKVHLGQFPAGTGIGWFLVANGYNNSSRTVGAGNWLVYSDSKLNPEPNANQKQHIVQLYDETRDLIILGFEDILRNNGACDNDFNDAIFYVSANPIEAIDRSGLEAIKKSIDSDGDGVYDYDDEFPLDPTKSATSYSPSVTTNGSLCFEDNWPSMGDYDFNDLVVDYKYTYYTNASNNLTELKAQYWLKAIGASMHNGFGVEFDLAPSDVKSVSGYKHTENFIAIAGNGTESGQSKATVIVFDDAHKQMSRASNSQYVNTDNPNDQVQPVLFEITIKLNSGVKPTDLGKAPYNCFLISNGNRGREVHMVDHTPTDLVNENLFSTAADNSELTIDRTYQNKNNMPWVLHTPQTLVYPREKINIYECYPYFGDWAKSEGRAFGDWYEDKPGHRVNSKLFKK